MLAPLEARGLPLCTLHGLFHRLLLAAQGPLPQASGTTIAAMRSATLLYALIGESFSAEGDGSDEMQQSSDL